MTAIGLHLLQPNKEVLQEQLDYCSFVTGKLRDIIEQFLEYEGIYSLDEVDAEVKDDYLEYVNHLAGITAGQRKYYRNLLEQVWLAYKVTIHTELVQQVETIIKDRTTRNKLLQCLIEHGINDCNEIDYDTRTDFEESLNMEGTAKVNEYVKSMDILKLEAIKKANKQNPLMLKTLNYSNKKIFLLYHPDYELGMTFYYIRDKEELLFDFSMQGSAVVKRQIFKMLCYVLEEKKDWHDRRERFLIPLKKLYLFCMENEIDDIELLTEAQIEAFRKSMDGKVGTKTETYMQIVYNITKYLFLNAKNANWNANMWYLERFTFNDGRSNPAREIERISFGQIENEKNRAVLKNYMKYQIAVTQRTSLQTIRCQYYDICSFLKYCDEQNWILTDINAEMIEQYVSIVDLEDIKEEAYNRRIISVARLFNYMKSKKQIDKEPLHFDYYLKTVHTKHNNRTVSAENQREIIAKLKHLPLHLRLMFLNLWCEGIRECEVCVIKAGMYSYDGQDAWLKLYQNKMKKEKVIPIPTELYKLMKNYIKTNDLKADDYVFQNRKGGAYDAGTFTKQMKQELKKAGVKDYDFKAHDFRHTVGTRLNKEHGVSIEVIRDFLGHNTSDMTKQYIDFVPELLDTANEEYFTKKENQLATYIKKGKKKNGR